VFLRLMACQYILERIALTRRNPDVYAHFLARRETFITDLLQPASDEAPGDLMAAAAAAAEAALPSATAAAAAAAAAG
jgi:hypothetical protein